MTTSVFEYWEANNIPYNIVAEDEKGYWVNHNRVAKTSLKRAHYYHNPSTPVKQCERCGVWGSTKKVQDRWICEMRCICISCWNKLKPIEKAEKILAECVTLANRLTKEAREYDKQNRRDPQRNFVRHHRRFEKRKDRR